MTACGMWPSDAEANIKARKMAFDKATRVYERKKGNKQIKAPMTTRANKKLVK